MSHQKQLIIGGEITAGAAARHLQRAMNEDLVFVGFLRGVPGTPSNKVDGTLNAVS